MTATVEGCKPKIKKASASRRGVSLRLSGLGAGRLVMAGQSVVRTTRILKAATEATIKASLTAKARRTLRRVGHVKVAVTVRFAPRSGARATVRKTLIARR